MASKKATNSRKVSKKRSPAASKVTEKTITFRLTPEEVERAQKCLEESGSIRYSFRNIKVTKLPHVLDDGKLID